MDLNGENRYYVYHIINPIDNRLFYVGKGTGNRCKQHLTDKKEYSFNKRLNGYIRNLIESGTPPNIVKIAENLTEEEAYILEEAEIKKHGRRGLDENGILLNILDSGRPPKFTGEDHPWWGRKHSEKSKKKISETKKQRIEKGLIKVRNGFTHTEETKQKISEANKGRKRTPEMIEKTRQANLGRKQTDHQKEAARDANAKQWIIIKPDGQQEIITNLKQYCHDNNLSESSMYCILSGRMKQHKGYKIARLQTRP